MTKEQKEIITHMRADRQGYNAIAKGTGLKGDCVKIWRRKHGLGDIVEKKTVLMPDTDNYRNCGKRSFRYPAGRQGSSAATMQSGLMEQPPGRWSTPLSARSAETVSRPMAMPDGNTAPAPVS